MTQILMREMTWAELQPLATDSTVVVLPVGAIEQHGKHLPLEVDSRIVEELAVRAAGLAKDRVRVLVAPTMAFGASQHHMGFPGTMTLTTDTFTRVVEELCESLIHHGFRRILVLNGHGGNDDLIRTATRNVADRTGVAIATASYWFVAANELATFQDVEVGGIPGHGCGFETSCYLAVRPELARMEAAAEWSPPLSGSGDFGKRINRAGGVQMPKQATPASAYGTRGDPRLGSAEKGRKYVGIIEQRLADALIALGQGAAPIAPAAYPGPGRGADAGSRIPEVASPV
jgi:creatinine amidohydrolase